MNELEIVEAQERIYRLSYPQKCQHCHDTRQYSRNHIARGGLTARLHWTCTTCGADKGPAVASPLELHISKRWEGMSEADREAFKARFADLDIARFAGPMEITGETDVGEELRALYNSAKAPPAQEPEATQLELDGEQEAT